MSKEEIKEKYKIEPILKEMWVWDELEKAILILVAFEDLSKKFQYPFVTCSKDGMVRMFANASETNPNEPKQPKVGDKGYFWDDETYYAYDVILSIINTNGIKDLRAFNAHFSGNYKNFSHEKQPWMK